MCDGRQLEVYAVIILDPIVKHLRSISRDSENRPKRSRSFYSVFPYYHLLTITVACRSSASANPQIGILPMLHVLKVKDHNIWLLFPFAGV